MKGLIPGLTGIWGTSIVSGGSIDNLDSSATGEFIEEELINAHAMFCYQRLVPAIVSIEMTHHSTMIYQSVSVGRSVPFSCSLYIAYPIELYDNGFVQISQRTLHQASMRLHLAAYLSLPK